MQALKSWGALDGKLRLPRQISFSSDFRGYAKDPGGGVGRCADPGRADQSVRNPEIASLALPAEFRAPYLSDHDVQPVGGMDMIGKAFAREVGGVIRYDAKVTPDTAE